MGARDSVVVIEIRWGLDGSRLELRWGQEMFSSTQPSTPVLGPTQAPEYRVLALPGVKHPDVSLIAHSHLAPRLRNSTAIHLHFHCVCIIYGEIFVLFVEGVLLNCSCCVRATCDLMITVQKAMLSYTCIYRFNVYRR